MKARPIARAEDCDKVRHKRILGFLRQSHSQQFESKRRRSLTDVVRETGITRETKFKILASKPVKLPVVQTLHPERMHGFNIVTFSPQCANEFSG